MILDFADAAPEELGEILWSSWMAMRLVRWASPELREFEPRPEWSNQDAETRALWRNFAARLLSLYSPRDGI